MKATNKLFTTSQLVGIISIAIVLITVVTLLITQDFSSFANQIQ